MKAEHRKALAGLRDEIANGRQLGSGDRELHAALDAALAVDDALPQMAETLTRIHRGASNAAMVQQATYALLGLLARLLSTEPMQAPAQGKLISEALEALVGERYGRMSIPRDEQVIRALVDVLDERFGRAL